MPVKRLGNAEHTNQMRVGWSHLGVTQALRYQENGAMGFSESLTALIHLLRPLRREAPTAGNNCWFTGHSDPTRQRITPLALCRSLLAKLPRRKGVFFCKLFLPMTTIWYFSPAISASRSRAMPTFAGSIRS